jgi:hypothetical protein
VNAVPRDRERQSTEPRQVFTIAWNRVHVALESPFTFPWNPCSPSRGIRSRFDLAQIRSFLVAYAKNCASKTWPEAATKLSRLAKWEFEDYRA